MAKNNASLPDVNTMIQAGLNPKTGLPYREGNTASEIQANVNRFVRIQDEQAALNRYTWYNLPSGLDGNLIERILYYKGQAAFFFMETNQTFYFLPYALDGTIDVYGRYTGITPIPFAGGSTDGKKDKPWIIGLTKNPVYDVVLDEELDKATFMDSAVLLSDYSKGLSQNIIPRSILNQSLIEVQAETIPAMRTSLINSTGVSGMRVTTEDESANVYAASQGVYNAAMNGKKWIPIIGSVDFQDFGQASGTAQAQEYLMAYQALNNLRLSGYGIGGGVYQKAQHMLQSENDMNNVNVQLILEDGLYQRQNFCNIVNSIWQLGIWCDISESLQLFDTLNENEGDAMAEQEQGSTQQAAADEGGDEQNE